MNYMSEMYEAIIVHGDRVGIAAALAGLNSPLRLRLVPLIAPWFGIHRDAGRHERFDRNSMVEAARRLAARLGQALAVFYDNQSGLRAAVLVDGHRVVREFDDKDELWVPLTESGEPEMDAKRFAVGELDEGGEYECVLSAIDLGLAAIGAMGEITPRILKNAFHRPGKPGLS